jgi:hypothetical protein
MTLRKMFAASYPWNIVGLAFLALALGVVLFSGTSPISEDTIKQKLQAFSEQVASEAILRGKEAKFSYGDVAITGWGYDKRAVVTDVSLEISEKSTMETNRWGISTAKMVITPDPSVAERLFFTFPEPMNVIANSQLKSTVSFSSPLLYTFYDGSLKSPRVFAHEIRLPEKIISTPARNVDASASPAKPLIVTLDKDSLISLRSHPDSGAHEIRYGFNNVNIVFEDNSEINIAALNSTLNESPAQGNRTNGEYTLSVTDIIHRGATTNNPYSMQVELSYESDRPQAGKPLTSMDIKLGRFAIMNDDFKLQAKGNVSLTADDPLPYGNVDMEIINAGKFLASELLPDMLRPAITSLLEKTNGAEAVAAGRISVPLKREKNGVFYIGDSTFEELTAAIVSDLLKPPAAAPAEPATPITEEPEISVPSAPAAEEAIPETPKEPTDVN